MELSLILPIVFLVVMVIIQIALLINTAIVVNYAAYCAARAGIVHLDEVSYSKRAARMVLASLSIEGALLSSIETARNNEEFRVTVKYPLLLIFRIDWLPIREIKGQCTMVAE